MNNPPNIKDKKRSALYMFLKVKKVDRIIELCATAYHLLCPVSAEIRQKLTELFLFLYAWILLKPKPQRNVMSCS